MSNSNYNRREFIALTSLALSAATIPGGRGETSGEVQCLAYDDEGQPLSASGFARFPRARKVCLWGGGNGGEAMVWHDDFTETIQADYVESVYTIAYSKPWLEAITCWDFNGSGHDGFIRGDGTPREATIA
jgi:hypothetical protein